MTGIKLRHLGAGDHFRTLLTNRVGILREKGQYALRVGWKDLGGPSDVHRELIVEPWPRGEA